MYVQDETSYIFFFLYGIQPKNSIPKQTRLISYPSYFIRDNRGVFLQDKNSNYAQIQQSCWHCLKIRLVRSLIPSPVQQNTTTADGSSSLLHTSQPASPSESFPAPMLTADLPAGVVLRVEKQSQRLEVIAWMILRNSLL